MNSVGLVEKLQRRFPEIVKVEVEMRKRLARVFLLHQINNGRRTRITAAIRQFSGLNIKEVHFIAGQ